MANYFVTPCRFCLQSLKHADAQSLKKREAEREWVGTLRPVFCITSQVGVLNIQGIRGWSDLEDSGNLKWDILLHYKVAGLRAESELEQSFFFFSVHDENPLGFAVSELELELELGVHKTSLGSHQWIWGPPTLSDCHPQSHRCPAWLCLHQSSPICSWLEGNAVYALL